MKYKYTYDRRNLYNLIIAIKDKLGLCIAIVLLDGDFMYSKNLYIMNRGQGAEFEAIRHRGDSYTLYADHTFKYNPENSRLRGQWMFYSEYRKERKALLGTIKKEKKARKLRGKDLQNIKNELTAKNL